MTRVGALALQLALCAIGAGAFMNQKVSGDERDRKRWDRRFAGPDYVYGTEPSRFLAENAGLLPARGRALDVAAGEGRNAVYLARLGFDVDAVDISEVGLAKARRLADEAGVAVSTIVADLREYVPERERYDVVVVFNYLQRDLVDAIEAALKPGGILVYETYTTDQSDIPGAHRLRREYLLEPGELRSMFGDLEVLEYRETIDEHRAVAGLIARKPPGREGRDAENGE